MASVRKRIWDSKGVRKEAWVVSYTDQLGKRRLKTFERKKEADAYRNKVAIEIQRGEHVPDSQTVTLSRALDLWLENCEARVLARDRMRPRTVRNFRSWTENHIRPRIGHLMLTKLNYQVIQAFVDDLAYDREKRRSHATITNVLSCLRLTLKFAYRRGLVGPNALVDRDIRVPGEKGRREDIPTKAEIRAFLASAGENSMGGVARWLKPLLYVSVFAGLRQGELRALTWGCVDFDGRVLSVVAGMDNLGHVDEPKSRAGRRDVPMGPELVTELKRWKLAQPRNARDLVFVGRNGAPLSPAQIRQSFLRLQHRVANGGKGRTAIIKDGYAFHTLRHVCASLLIESGLPPKRIQTIMGHASINMTYDIYGHLFEDQGQIDAALTKIASDLVA